MDEKQYLKMRAKAEDEFKKNLEAIDRVWYISHPDKAPPAPKTPKDADVIHVSSSVVRLPEPLASNGHRPFVLSEAVKQVIAQMPEESGLSQPIILGKLLVKHPDLRPRVEKDQIKAQIAGLLSRMAKRDELIRTKESHGSEPAVFRKPPDPPALSLDE
jgi:hypothetical protein